MTCHAAESLTFTPIEEFRSIAAHKNIDFGDKDTSLSAIATVDLNGDSLDEYIGKTTADSSQNSDIAPFYVFSSTSLHAQTPIYLGVIHARTIMLGYESHHGVRDILAFSNIDNDFDYDAYTWNPMHSRYVHEKQITNNMRAEVQ